MAKYYIYGGYQGIGSTGIIRRESAEEASRYARIVRDNVLEMLGIDTHTECKEELGEWYVYPVREDVSINEADLFFLALGSDRLSFKKHFCTDILVH